MKYEVNKDRLKSFIKKRLGVDLTGDITMITSSQDIPGKFIGFITHSNFRTMMNRFGPMFLVKGKDSEYLTQERSDVEKGSWFILSDNDPDFIQSFQRKGNFLLKELGLDVLGIDLGTIIDLYVTDEENTLESINESKGIINVIGNYMLINYPNFTNKNAEIIKKRKNIPGVFRPEISINYYNPVNKFLFARYWPIDIDKELQLDPEIFDDLSTAFSGHMDKVVDWFNNEFGQDAESVTY